MKRMHLLVNAVIVTLGTILTLSALSGIARADVAAPTTGGPSTVTSLSPTDAAESAQTVTTTVVVLICVLVVLAVVVGAFFLRRARR